mgnify:CR=1 FL=1
MNKINILVTGGGSPGIIGTIYSLKNNYDQRDIQIVCTDAKSDCVGKYVADKFYQIKKANDIQDYLSDIFSIVISEKIDVILPQNTAELSVLSKNKSKLLDMGCKVIISSYNNLIRANSKFELLEVCKELEIPYPDYYLIKNKGDLIAKATKLGWPDNTVLIKHPSLNGSRGIRIIDENINYKDLFYNQKPTNMYTKLDDFLKIIGDNFDPLLVMEYLSGEEVSIDVFRDSENFISIPRLRNEIRSGISFKNSAVKRSDLIGFSKKLSDYLDLEFCFGFQFKYDKNGIPKILECNPRVQGTMIFSTIMGANIIYSSIKSCLGEKIPQFSLDWNTRLLRYWGAVGMNDKVTKI